MRRWALRPGLGSRLLVALLGTSGRSILNSRTVITISIIVTAVDIKNTRHVNLMRETGTGVVRQLPRRTKLCLGRVQLVVHHSKSRSGRRCHGRCRDAGRVGGKINYCLVLTAMVF